jgi:hypothetical protein
MKPDDVTNAITQVGSQWIVSTIVAFLPVLWTMTLILHLGRPYILRTLRHCGLRLGADIWWMSYLLLRDGLILITFALSWIFFQPNLVATIPLPITGSLAALSLLLVLAVKLSRRVDDDVQAYRLATILLVVGATLYYGPLVFAVEAASQEYLSGFSHFFTSNSNVTVALYIMWISLVGVGIVAVWLFIRAWSAATRTMTKRLTARSIQKKEPAAV